MTMTTETRELVERLTGLLAKATPGEWSVAEGSVEDGSIYVDADDTGERPVALIMSGSPHNQDRADAALIVAAVNALPDLLATITCLTEEVERLRGLVIDPSDPAWEDARTVLVAELRKAALPDHARSVADGGGSYIPSWIALNLIASAARATLARSSGDE